jgi:hypothetical protein
LHRDGVTAPIFWTILGKRLKPISLTADTVPPRGGESILTNRFARHTTPTQTDCPTIAFFPTTGCKSELRPTVSEVHRYDVFDRWMAKHHPEIPFERDNVTKAAEELRDRER